MSATRSVADKLARGFNLSRWAIGHGNFTAFLLVLLLAAGGYSLVHIGQKFDPDFTFRVMVVQVAWARRSRRCRIKSSTRSSASSSTSLSHRSYACGVRKHLRVLSRALRGRR